jgi:prepilin-type N-terminal cleavage/methylation domain-containing protein
MEKHNIIKNQDGLTMVELVIVTTVMAGFAAVIVGSYLGTMAMG